MEAVGSRRGAAPATARRRAARSPRRPLDGEAETAAGRRRAAPAKARRRERAAAGERSAGRGRPHPAPGRRRRRRCGTCCRRTRCCGAARTRCPYECDGLTAYREQPLVVVLPATEARGRGGAARLPPARRAGGRARLRHRPVGRRAAARARRHARRSPSSTASSRSTPTARTATVQCGVRNLAVSEAAAALGLYYAPDPSSQIACSIGGNVAENSGGVHCLKYGLTLHNVLKVRGFTADGEPVEFGADALDAPGLDLMTRHRRQRGHARGRDRGHRQAAAEAAARALRDGELRRRPQGRRRGRRHHRRRHHPGRPRDDGQADDARGRGLRARRLRPRRRGDPALRERRHARRGRGGDRPHRAGDAGERRNAARRQQQRGAAPARSGAVRKNAFPASGRISPDYMCMDSTIPRRRLGRHAARHRAAWSRPTACAAPTCSTPATATCTP